MREDMIERVARALCACQEPTPWERIEESGGSIPTRDDFRDAARAAIAAMREPTEAMLAPMNDYAPLQAVATLLADHGEFQPAQAASDIWKCIIDAALKTHAKPA